MNGRAWTGPDARAAGLIALATIALHPQLVLGMPWRFGHDCLEYAVPHALFFFRELAAGRVPLWNPFHDGGAPFLAQPPWMGPFYPGVLLFLLPMGRALDAGFLLHIVWFAVGSFALARVRGLGHWPALLAALAVGAGTPLSDLARLGYLPEAVALSYLPWVLVFLDRGIRGAIPMRSAIAGAGLCLGVMHLGGHLVASGVVLFSAAFYALALGASQGSRKALLRALGMLAASEALGAALAAVQLLPLVGAGLESSLSEGREISSEYAYLSAPWRLGNLLFARFDPSGKGHLFIGTTLLPFVVLAGRRSAVSGRRNLDLWVLLAGSLALSLGDATPAWRALRALVPPLRIFSYFYFFVVPAALALALLAAHGLEEARRTATRDRPYLALLGAVAVLAVSGRLVLAASDHGQARALVRPHVLAAMPWMLFGLAGAAVAARWPRSAVVAVSVTLSIELAHFAVQDGVESAPAFRVERYFDRAGLAESLPPPGTGRVLGVERARYARDWALRRNGGLVLGYEDVGRDSKLPLMRLEALTSRLASVELDWVGRLAASKQPPEGEHARLWLAPTSSDVRILDVLGVTALATDVPVDGGAFQVPFRSLLRSHDDGGPVRVWQRASPVPRFYLSGEWRRADSLESAFSTLLGDGADPWIVPVVEGVPAGPDPSYERAGQEGARVNRRWLPGAITFDTWSERPTVLVTGELVARGWRATVDGSRVATAIANVVELAVPVPAGLHHVAIRYLPGELVSGAVLTALAAAVLALIVFSRSRVARPEAQAESRSV